MFDSLNVLGPFVAFNVVVIGFLFRYFHEEPASWFRFSALCYSVMFFGGVSLVLMMEYLFEFKMPVQEIFKIYIDALLGGLAAYVGFWLFYLFNPRSKRQFEFPPQLRRAEIKALKVLAGISLFSIFIFIGANGLHLGNVEYEHRYDASRGWGAVILFFPAFLPFAYFAVANSRGFFGFLIWSLFSLSVGFLTYIALSGYRQIAIGTLLIVLVVAIRRGYLRKWHILPGLFALIGGIVLMSFARYAGDQTGVEFDSWWMAAFYYLQGDIFPVDAPLKIYLHYMSSGNSYQGFDVVLSHFGKIVPRFLWDDKPAIVYDSAGYYTQVIVDYGRGVTLSPTVMGEGYLIGGSYAFYFLMFVSAIILCWMDRLAEKRRDFSYFVISFVYAGFFFVREGFSELLLRVFFVGVFYFVFLLFARRPRRF